ncbi:hypothetical protein ACXU4B_08900 [Dyella soli]|uniref:Uncharacterized protein n=1 Tax=Dyella soli TaxID=522319 RepID=A0A4V2NM00_9GAMM|nr:hypothetical protein [Dyella soli]TCI11061.1 hypothetical protein EZM97_19790 [Dyella soli]
MASVLARWLRRVLPAAAWTGLVALLPWWADLSVLLLLALGAVLLAQRIVHYAARCRRGLRWGLPGLLFAVQRALGGDLVAWGAALLGALVGFSLVALMESLLDRPVRRVAHAPASPEWSELALAPTGPRAHIIELVRVAWGEVGGEFTDPDGDPVRYEAIGAGQGRYVFAAGQVIERVSARCCFGPDGRWFVASLPGGRGDVLWDRHGERMHRVSGWELCGWEGGQPWLARRGDGVPAPLHEVLGRGRRR